MQEAEANSDDVSVLLQGAQAGDDNARDRLLNQLAIDLKKSAKAMMQAESQGHTLQPTALVNEACMQLLDQNVLLSAQNRRYLFGAAHRAMQQILIDHSRRRNAIKRGGDRRRVPLDHLLENFERQNNVSFEDLFEALRQLQDSSPRQREIVEHRFFGGFSVEQTAELMEISTATAKREWKLARAKLFASIAES